MGGPFVLAEMWQVSPISLHCGQINDVSLPPPLSAVVEAASKDDVKAWEAARVEFERDRIHNPKKADEFFKQDLVQGFFSYH